MPIAYKALRQTAGQLLSLVDSDHMVIYRANDRDWNQAEIGGLFVFESRPAANLFLVEAQSLLEDCDRIWLFECEVENLVHCGLLLSIPHMLSANELRTFWGHFEWSTGSYSRLLHDGIWIVPSPIGTSICRRLRLIRPLLCHTANGNNNLETGMVEIGWNGGIRR